MKTLETTGSDKWVAGGEKRKKVDDCGGGKDTGKDVVDVRGGQCWRNECNAKEGVRTESGKGDWMENIRGGRKAMSDVSLGEKILCPVKSWDSEWQKELTTWNLKTSKSMNHATWRQEVDSLLMFRKPTGLLASGHGLQTRMDPQNVQCSFLSIFCKAVLWV